MLIALHILSARQSVALAYIAALVMLLLAAGLMWRAGRLRITAAWLALYIAGQFCFFQLLQTGPAIQLQTFAYWGDILRSSRIYFLAFLFVQAALVAWGARSFWRTGWNVARKLLTPAQALALLLLLGYFVIVFPPELVQSLIEGGMAKKSISHDTRVGFALFAAAISLMNLILAVRALPATELAQAVAAIECRLTCRRLPWALALMSVLLSAAVTWFVFDRVPHIPDEASYLFQAKMLAAGKISLPAPPVPEAFNVPFSYVQDGRWILTLAPGWAAVLALGYWIGAPWLVNPLLGGITILVLHALLRRMHGVNFASIATILLALSPWFIFMNASLMNHTLTLLLFLLVLRGVLEARDRGSVGWALVVGLSAGAMLHIRPLDAVIAAAIGAGVWLSTGLRKIRIPALAATVAAGVFMTLLSFAYNRALTGDAFAAPMNKLFDQRYYPGSNRLGFGPDVGNWGWVGLDPLPGHGPIDVLVNTNQNLYMVNFDLFGWAFGSLLFVLLLFVWFEWRIGTVWWATAFFTIAALNLYWFSGGPDYGARYWYLVIVPAVVLTAQGAMRFAHKLRTLAAEPSAEARTYAFVVLACVLGFALLVPWRSIDKYKFYRGTKPDIRRLMQQNDFGHDLVFVRGRPMPDYASALQFNPPTFERYAAGPLFVMDVGPEKNAKLVEHYSDRRVWLIAGPREGGGQARILAGPLPPGTVPPAGKTQPE